MAPFKIDGAAASGLAAPELAHQDDVDLAPLGSAAAHAVVSPTVDKADAAVGRVEEVRKTDKQDRAAELRATAMAQTAVASFEAVREDLRVLEVHALIRTSFELLVDARNIEALNRAADMLALAQRVVDEMMAERRPQ